MTAAAKIKRQALALKPQQRLRLVQDIWNSLVSEPESVRIPEMHKRVIDARLAEHDADPQSAISLSEAKVRVRKHLAGKRGK
jgi:putative addiction module component (TIGR02574 family)